jgi:Amt family ammonium transporter
MLRSSLQRGLMGSVALVVATGGGVLASSGGLPTASNGTALWLILAGCLAFLVPVGLTLLASGAASEDKAADVALTSLAAVGLAVLGYFACGFAFQFGGIGLFSDLPGVEDLIWEWSFLDVSWGPGWGMVGLKGFFLGGEADNPAAYALFFSQLALVTTVVLIPALSLRRKVKGIVIVLGALLLSAVVYPILGNWVWGGGWLAHLGSNLGLSHGFIDFAGAGLVNLVGGTAALAGILVFKLWKPKEERSSPEAVSPLSARALSIPPSARESAKMPPVHLPLLAILGSLLLVVGWLGWTLASPLNALTDASPAIIAVNLFLAAAGGTLVATLYSWFTTGRADVLMATRGLAIGLVSVSAAVPFVRPWAALLTGAVAGLLLPLSIYFLDYLLRLDDSTATVSVHSLGGLLGLLALGLFADGRYGVGWNSIGSTEYLGVLEQGVSGYFSARGFQPDWPNQLYAQLIGLAAIFVLTFVLTWLLFQLLRGLIQAWEGTGLELGRAPKPKAIVFDESSDEREEEDAEEEKTPEEVSDA